MDPTHLGYGKEALLVIKNFITNIFYKKIYVDFVQALIHKITETLHWHMESYPSKIETHRAGQASIFKKTSHVIWAERGRSVRNGGPLEELSIKDVEDYWSKGLGERVIPLSAKSPHQQYFHLNNPHRPLGFGRICTNV